MKTFTKEQLIAFGNYLLSKKRTRMTSPPLRGRVTHADVSNFEDMINERVETAKRKFTQKEVL